MTKTVLVMAGGTGGHVFPALACARLLRDQGYDVHWLGTNRGIEVDLVPQAGFPITSTFKGCAAKARWICSKRRSVSFVRWGNR